MVMQSILDSVKKNVGIDVDDDSFDHDIITHINSVFSDLQDFNVGPPEGFAIEDSSSQWGEYLAGINSLNRVKSYMYLRVRMLFDLPTTSFTQQAMKDQIRELEWRLTVDRDPEPVIVVVDPYDVI